MAIKAVFVYTCVLILQSADNKLIVMFGIVLLEFNSCTFCLFCRPFFTYWVTFVQIVCYVVSVAVYGFSPIGISVTSVESEVSCIAPHII